MRSAEQTAGALRERFPEINTRSVDTAFHVTVAPDRLREHMVYLRDELAFDFLVFVAGLDRPAEGIVELVYRLFSHESRTSVVLRVRCPRDGARVSTVSDIFRTAEWHERETAEMFGVQFDGHPDPRRLLLPDDLEGFPLRKDFTHPNLIRLPEAQ
jgi:NADH-quinone oxidoreductase subunit C